MPSPSRAREERAAEAYLKVRRAAQRRARPAQAGSVRRSRLGVVGCALETRREADGEEVGARAARAGRLEPRHAGWSTPHSPKSWKPSPDV